VPRPVPLDAFPAIQTLFSRLHLPNAETDVTRTLGGVTLRPTVLEEFRPLAESLEWQLGRLYWKEAGVTPFVRNEIPYLVNNDGLASESAAVVLFAACCDAARLPDRILVLELGGGLGLFARFFVESFARLCQQQGTDYYDRLTYVLTDGSRRTVEQWRELGIFSGYEDHVVLAVCDATRPSRIEQLEGRAAMSGAWQAVICNYVLDVLPTAIVRSASAGHEQLCVRTHLMDDPALVGQYTFLERDEIRAMAASQDAGQHSALIPLMTLLDFESAFVPVPEPNVPYAEESLALARDGEHVVLNHGAIASLEALRDLIAPDGFILINDYGAVQPQQTPSQLVPQRFGPTMAVGLNFRVLEAMLVGRRFRVVTPSGDEARAIHARLLSRCDLPAACRAFENRFGGEAWSYFDGPITEARTHAAAGRKQEALENYQTALSRQPRNWHIIGEAAEFVGLQMREFAAGVELARAALELNPCYSAWLWNVLGDCLYCLERLQDAHEAYLQGERVDPTDPRVLLNLAYTYHHLGRLDSALDAVARGLFHDRNALHRERLLERQQQILVAVSARAQAEQNRLLRRAARFQQAAGG
jgi:tetratricopeptide (TPR) repeat protein